MNKYLIFYVTWCFAPCQPYSDDDDEDKDDDSL